MPELILWAAAGGVALVGYYRAKRLGLLEPVPTDPKARVAAYASAVMALVKDQLAASEVQSWSRNRVDYRKEGQHGAIWFEPGRVHCSHPGGEKIFDLGDLGQLTFSLDGERMTVTIVACETRGVEHISQVTVSMIEPQSQ